MEGRTVELFMDEFLLWRVYDYDKSLTDILFKYKHVELEAYAVVDGFKDETPIGTPTIQHVFIFKGERKRFAFANGMRINVAKAMHFVNDLHKEEGHLTEGKEVPKELMRDTILRSI